jgi:hypothetical protein
VPGRGRARPASWAPRRTRARNVVLYDPDDPDTTAATVELTGEESEVLAELLGRRGWSSGCPGSAIGNGVAAVARLLTST